jgi:DNA-binding SARP family transcriptional activator/tetratricopeptide (TPR) repeat protein
MITLRVLGSLRLDGLDRHHQLALLTGDKRIALLVYLLLAGRGENVRRDTLLSLFWPEADESHARGALRALVHQLRGALGPAVLQSRSDQELGVDLGRVQCDVLEFERACQSGDWATAIDLYRGPPLEGFGLRGAPGFEDWLAGERTRIQGLARDLAWQVAERARGVSDHAGEIAALRRLLAWAPYEERPVRQLMSALDRLGDRAGALQTFEEFAARLQAELDVTPAPETVDLHATLRTRAVVVANARPLESIRAPAIPRAEIPPVTAGVALHRPEERPRSRPQDISEPPGTRRHPWRRLLLWTSAFAILVLLLSTVPSRRGPGSRSEAGAAASLNRIVLADFLGDSGLAEAVTTAFRVDLIQSPQVRLMSERRAAEALRRMDDSGSRPLSLAAAMELALREGFPVVLSGEVHRAGRGFILSARLIAAGSGEEIGAARESARDSTALLEAIERLSRALRRGLGESHASIRESPSLDRVTTSSLEALRFYSTSTNELAGPDDAISRLREALVRDTGFAMAHWRLATIYAAWGPPSERRASLLRAYQLRHRLPEPERSYVEAQYARVFELNPGRARLVLESLVRRWPTDPEALTILTDIHMLRHEFTEAEDYAVRALGTGNRFVDYYNAFVVQVAQEKYEAALATLARMDDSLPSHAFSHRLRGELEAARRDFPAATTHLEAYHAAAVRTGSRRDQSGANATLAQIAEVTGRIAAAKQFLERDLDPQDSVQGWVRIGRATWLARLDLWYGADTAGAVQRVRQVLVRYPLNSLPPLDRPHGSLAGFYLDLGQAHRARALLGARRLLGDTTERAWIAAAAQLDQGAGRYDKAIARWLEYIARTPAECPSCGMFQLAHAWDLAGQPDSAITWLERALATSGSRRVQVEAPWLGRSYARLGELYEKRRDLPEARRHYRSAIDLWKDADPSFHSRLRELHRRLAVLQERTR